jgi:shikimate dehydrogenase
MHNAAYKALGMDNWQYDKSAIPPDVLKSSIKQFMMHGYVGLNVTIPFKQEVLQYTRPDAIASAVGAANTLILPRNTSTNTDVAGFMNDLAAHDVDVKGMNVVLMGAGGAARAALYGLVHAGARVAVVNRTPANAQKMIQQVGVFAMTMSQKDASTWGANLVVNATSVGMSPIIDRSPWKDSLPLPENAIVYDMVYVPAKTKLMLQAEAQGLRAIGGLGMLVRQGAAAFEIWTERDAPIDVMFDALKQALTERDN